LIQAVLKYAQPEDGDSLRAVFDHLAFSASECQKRERYSVVVTKGAIAAIVMSLTLGLGSYLLIQLPLIILAASVGMWLFYVQHQYEDVYWQRQRN